MCVYYFFNSHLNQSCGFTPFLTHISRYSDTPPTAPTAPTFLYPFSLSNSNLPYLPKFLLQL